MFREGSSLRIRKGDEEPAVDIAEFSDSECDLSCGYCGGDT